MLLQLLLALVFLHSPAFGFADSADASFDSGSADSSSGAIGRVPIFRDAENAITRAEFLTENVRIRGGRVAVGMDSLQIGHRFLYRLSLKTRGVLPTQRDMLKRVSAQCQLASFFFSR